MLAFENGHLRRPGRLFAVAALFAFPSGRQTAQQLQKGNLVKAEPLQERDLGHCFSLSSFPEGTPF